MKRRAGFTLIEIIIVITLIGVLIARVGANMFSTLSKGKDARRKSDIAQLQRALELYQVDQNPDSYPANSVFVTGLCNQCWSQGANCTGNIYMQKFPCDPKNNTTPYLYTIDVTDSLKYTLVACLDNASDSQKDATKDSRCGLASYTVHEP